MFKRLTILLVFFSPWAWSDVPHVFKDGDVIRAEEINENFSALDQSVSSASQGNENAVSRESGKNEDYTYNQKDLATGRRKLTILGEVYDIVQMDTISFKDHALYSVKFPDHAGYYSDLYYDFDKDAHRELGFYAYQDRDDTEENWPHKISGYPAKVIANVYNYSEAETFYEDNPSQSEWTADGDVKTVYARLYGGEYDYYELKTENYSIRCEDPKYTKASDDPDYLTFTWTFSTGTSDRDTVTSFDKFQESYDECLNRLPYRVNKYNVYTRIDTYASIELDEDTIVRFTSEFDEKEYYEALGEECSEYSSSMGTGRTLDDCGKIVTVTDRNYSDELDEQSILPRATVREDYIKQLFEFYDHIIITKQSSSE